MQFAWGLPTIGPARPGILNIELPANLAPGVWLFRVLMDGHPEKSPPFMVRLLPRIEETAQ
jgi:hypothetical protein